MGSNGTSRVKASALNRDSHLLINLISSFDVISVFSWQELYAGLRKVANQSLPNPHNFLLDSDAAHKVVVPHLNSIYT